MVVYAQKRGNAFAESATAHVLLPSELGVFRSQAKSFKKIRSVNDAAAPDPSFTGWSGISLECSVKTFDQRLSVERLGQQANRSGFLHSRTDGLVGEGRNENERHALLPVAQEGLQFDTAHYRHLDVGNHAGCVIEVGRLQEFLGRRKRMHDVPKRA
jgi:hypothetical protein